MENVINVIQICEKNGHNRHWKGNSIANFDGWNSFKVPLGGLKSYETIDQNRSVKAKIVVSSSIERIKIFNPKTTPHDWPLTKSLTQIQLNFSGFHSSSGIWSGCSAAVAAASALSNAVAFWFFLLPRMTHTRGPEHHFFRSDNLIWRSIAQFQKCQCHKGRMMKLIKNVYERVSQFSPCSQRPSLVPPWYCVILREHL